MNITNVLISFVCGALGGNIAGALMPDKSLGLLVNSLAGILGGALGGQLLQTIFPLPPIENLNILAILAHVTSSGIGGAVLMWLAGVIKNVAQK